LTGLAENTNEVRKWPLDKRILMGNLANKILSEQIDRQSTSVENGVIQFWNALQKAKKQ